MSELVDIGMPRLSDSMEEATVQTWLKRPGDRVSRGEPLVEVETDKATVVYESELEGVLEEIVVGEGQTAELGALIARLRPEAAQQQPPVPVTERPPASRRPALPLRATARSSSGKRSGRPSTRSSNGTSA